MSNHLDSFDGELHESQFFRMFALGCFDAFITLPISTTSLVANIELTGPPFPFYPGWTLVHSEWEPNSIPKTAWSTSKWNELSVYWDDWINPFFALVFFALFGLTPEARKGYRKFFRFLGRLFGSKQWESTEKGLPDAVFKSGRETNTIATSNISSRSGLSMISARKRLLIISCSSHSADVSA